MADLQDVYAIAGSGLQAQSQRIKIISENIANAQTTPEKPGEEPYRRQIVSFRNEFDKALGVHKVEVADIRHDKSDFVKRYDPSHPAADKDGYIMTPNVRPLVETMDMREAQRSYEANVTVIEAARSMVSRTIEILR
jgi:flagellar basal-body rod protein FlgC